MAQYHVPTRRHIFEQLLDIAAGNVWAKSFGIISESDGGADPLPKRIAVAKINLGSKEAAASYAQEALDSQQAQSRGDMLMRLLEGREMRDEDLGNNWILIGLKAVVDLLQYVDHRF